jgi:hypothetical protein
MERYAHPQGEVVYTHYPHNYTNSQMRQNLCRPWFLVNSDNICPWITQLYSIIDTQTIKIFTQFLSLYFYFLWISQAIGEIIPHTVLTIFVVVKKSKAKGQMFPRSGMKKNESLLRANLYSYRPILQQTFKFNNTLQIQYVKLFAVTEIIQFYV